MFWSSRIQYFKMHSRVNVAGRDPRHSFTDNIGTGFEAGTFSQWPESLGLAAIRDAELVRKFAETAREEYLAVGLRSALHPQVDLSTEPRWARIGGTCKHHFSPVSNPCLSCFGMF